MPSSSVEAASSGPLTTAESIELEKLETVIDHGMKTFVEVGDALTVIRDRRLFRGSFETFETYVQEKFGINRSRAYQLIDAAAVVHQIASPDSAKADLSTTVDIAQNVALSPDCENQARPLTKLATPAERKEAWAEAVKTAPTKAGKPNVTAKAVKAAVEKVKAKRAVPAAESSPTPPPAINPDAPPFVPFNDELDAISDQLDAAADHLTRLCGFSEKQQHAETQWAQHISWQASVKPIRGVISHLKTMRPAELDGSKIGFVRAEIARNRKAVAASMR